MNDQNYFVNPDSNNLNQQPNNLNNMYQAPASQVPVAPTAAPVQNTGINFNESSISSQPVTNNYQAPTEPQPSNVTFDYNQLYGNNKPEVTNATNQKAVVFEEPSFDTTAKIADETPKINISNDELIPEFDTSVLEVIPEQEKQNIKVNQTANVSTMASGKQAERDQNRSNVLFLAIVFGIIIVSVFFLFPIVFKM